MPAARFYAMLKAGREMSYQRDSWLLKELCDVQAISICGGEYAEKLRAVYEKRALGIKDTPEKSKAMDPADPRTAEIILSMFGNGGRRLG